MTSFSVCAPDFLQGSISSWQKNASCLVFITLTLMMAGIPGLSGYPAPKSVLPNFSQGATTSTTTAVVSSANPSSPSQSLTLTATVTSQSTGTPTGSVTFLDGATQLGQATLDANGQAQF